MTGKTDWSCIMTSSLLAVSRWIIGLALKPGINSLIS